MPAARKASTWIPAIQRTPVAACRRRAVMAAGDRHGPAHRGPADRRRSARTGAEVVHGQAPAGHLDSDMARLPGCLWMRASPIRMQPYCSPAVQDYGHSLPAFTARAPHASRIERGRRSWPGRRWSRRRVSRQPAELTSPGPDKKMPRNRTAELRPSPQSSRSAAVTGIVAARTAGNSPPIRPMASAHFSPCQSTPAVTCSSKLSLPTEPAAIVEAP